VKISGTDRNPELGLGSGSVSGYGSNGFKGQVINESR